MKKTLYIIFMIFGQLLFSQEENSKSNLDAVEIIELDFVPVFPGCENVSKENQKNCFQQKLNAHVQKTFSYPPEAMDQNITGRVYINFIINKSGDIENIQTKGAHYLLRKEAEGIIKKLPKLVPGELNGKIVKVRYTYPITFTIAN